MTLEKFLETHRELIDGHIRSIVNFDGFEIDDQERMLWIMNDESLYNHAVRYCGLEEVLGVTDE